MILHVSFQVVQFSITYPNYFWMIEHWDIATTSWVPVTGYVAAGYDRASGTVSVEVAGGGTLRVRLIGYGDEIVGNAVPLDLQDNETYLVDLETLYIMESSEPPTNGNGEVPPTSAVPWALLGITSAVVGLYAIARFRK